MKLGVVFDARLPLCKRYLSEVNMRNISTERFIATNVMIRFEDGSESFCVQRGSTLADISENLDRIAQRHDGYTFQSPG
jgi:hypothetical protein